MKLKKFKFKKVKSTNNTAIRIIKETKYNLGMVVTETQVNGRGQYGRKWISSKGNLFISFFNELNKTKLSINAITKINCLLVKKLLSSFTSKKILFKKPNDLLIDKKKISGILPVGTVQAIQLVNQQKGLFVDIRDAEEFKKEHIADSTNIPLSTLTDGVAKLKNPAQPIILVCASGQRSRTAAKQMRNSGFTEVYVLKGGLNTWKDAKLPLFS